MTTPISTPRTETATRPMTAAARPPVPAAIRLGRLVSAIVRYGVLLLVAAVIIVPIAYAVLGGFKDPAQLANDAIGLPNPWVTANYTDTLTSPGFWRQLANSTIIAGPLDGPGRPVRGPRRIRLRPPDVPRPRGALHAVHAGPAVSGGRRDPAAVHPRPRPGPARQPARDRPPEAAFGLPLTIVVLRPFFRSIPIELEDAASIDGCGSFGFFWRILLPLSRPVLATVGVLAIVASWNQFLLPLVMLSDESHWTLPLGVTNFSTQYTTDTARILAYTTLALIPALVFYLVAERQLVGGLTQGSVKG